MIALFLRLCGEDAFGGRDVWLVRGRQCGIRRQSRSALARRERVGRLARGALARRQRVSRLERLAERGDVVIHPLWQRAHKNKLLVCYTTVVIVACFFFVTSATAASAPRRRREPWRDVDKLFRAPPNTWL